jgi:hypothetical protein
MRHAKFNPALYLIVGLPLFAVIASVGTAVVAVTRGDAPFPDQYHWEGDKLDHDFAQSQRAADLHLKATIELQPQLTLTGQGVCHLTLALDGSGLPPMVDLALIHAAKSDLDRTIRFSRVANTSSYVAPCAPLPDGRWHVELSDPQHTWSFRAAMAGQGRTITLSSISPADDAT